MIPRGNPPDSWSYMSSLSGQLGGPLAAMRVRESAGRVHDAVLQDLGGLLVGWKGQLLGHGLLRIECPHLLLSEPCSMCARRESPQLLRGESRFDDNPFPHPLCPKERWERKPHRAAWRCDCGCSWPARSRLALVSHTGAVGPPGDTGQCLDTLLVATTGRGPRGPSGYVGVRVRGAAGDPTTHSPGLTTRTGLALSVHTLRVRPCLGRRALAYRIG